MRNIGILVALSVTLCGCGIAAKVQARQAYQLATANYDNCLEANQLVMLTNKLCCPTNRSITLFLPELRMVAFEP
jgi:hypothetical protein